MGVRMFDGAVAFLTGAASGIGAALARELAARGAAVVLADRQREAAEALARTLPGAESVELDVRQAEAVDAAVARTLERHERLDLMINNAGIGLGGEVKDYTLDDWRYIVDVNLMGVIHGVHAAYPRMVRQGFGHVVNVASFAGLVPSPFLVGYSATKHAVVGLSRALRLEGRPYGVRVSVVCPGVIRTAILEGGGKFGRVSRPVPPDAQRRMWDRLRPMDADEFAREVLDRVARNQAIIVVPGWWRAPWWLDRLSPALADALSYRSYLTTRAEYARAGQPPDA